MRRLSKVIGLVFVAVVLMAVDCRPDDPPAPAADVVLKDTAFNPDTLTVAIGASVLWLHDDGARPHTVTSGLVDAPDGVFDSREGDDAARMSDGDTFAHTFADAGTFSYHCIVHRDRMTGVIVVTP